MVASFVSLLTQANTVALREKCEVGDATANGRQYVFLAEKMQSRVRRANRKVSCIGRAVVVCAMRRLGVEEHDLQVVRCPGERERLL